MVIRGGSGDGDPKNRSKAKGTEEKEAELYKQAELRRAREGKEAKEESIIAHSVGLEWDGIGPGGAWGAPCAWCVPNFLP